MFVFVKHGTDVAVYLSTKHKAQSKLGHKRNERFGFKSDVTLTQ